MTIVKVVHKRRSSCLKVAHISSVLRPGRVHLTIFRNSAANRRNVLLVRVLEVWEFDVGVVRENHVLLLFLVVLLDLDRVLQQMSVQLYRVKLTNYCVIPFVLARRFWRLTGVFLISFPVFLVLKFYIYIYLVSTGFGYLKKKNNLSKDPLLT